MIFIATEVSVYSPETLNKRKATEKFPLIGLFLISSHDKFYAKGEKDTKTNISAKTDEPVQASSSELRSGRGGRKQ